MKLKTIERLAILGYAIVAFVYLAFVLGFGALLFLGIRWLWLHG